MPLHIVIKIRHSLFNELIVSYCAIPSLLVVPKPLSGPTNDDATVRARNKIVIVACIEADTIGIDQMRRVSSLGAADMAGDTPDRHDAARVFGQ
jgi:hypothetical protein